MPVAIGSNTLSKLYAGASEISKAYVGTNQVFANASPEPLGLSSSLLTLTGVSGTWTQQNVDVSLYANHQVRMVFKVKLVQSPSGSVFNNDVQVDSISLGGQSYTFESGVDGFERNSAATTSDDYGSLTWTAVTTATGGGGLWLRDSGGTASSSTGLTTGANGTTWYLYTESSSPAVWGTTPETQTSFWLRSPTIALGAGSHTATFWEGRLILGANVTLDFYLDVVAQP